MPLSPSDHHMSGRGPESATPHVVTFVRKTARGITIDYDHAAMTGRFKARAASKTANPLATASKSVPPFKKAFKVSDLFKKN